MIRTDEELLVLTRDTWADAEDGLLVRRALYSLGVADASAEPARTLRVEVTDDDVAAALEAWHLSGDGIVRALSDVLECFAVRLAARQWVEVPTEATIPAGMLVRIEGIPHVGGHTASELTLTRPWTAAERAEAYPDGTAVFLVPADRVGEMVLPDPDAELIERIAEAIYREARTGELRAAFPIEWEDTTPAQRAAWLRDARLAVAGVRAAGFVIEPAPTREGA